MIGPYNLIQNAVLRKHSLKRAGAKVVMGAEVGEDRDAVALLCHIEHRDRTIGSHMPAQVDACRDAVMLEPDLAAAEWPVRDQTGVPG